MLFFSEGEEYCCMVGEERELCLLQRHLVFSILIHIYCPYKHLQATVYFVLRYSSDVWDCTSLYQSEFCLHAKKKAKKPFEPVLIKSKWWLFTVVEKEGLTG